MKIYDYNGQKNICGEKIRQARSKLRMSQAALAAKLQTEGVVLERDCISRVEIGTRFVADYELMTFAKALNVSIDWLLSKD
jgi:transcriptional regulator with XRE-family HTH domain